MYQYIKGNIAELTASTLVIDVMGVGYMVNISLHTYSELSGKTEAKVWIHQVVKEDAHLLIGFSNQTERELYRLLISVSGVGMATALVIISSYSVDEIVNAILTENVTLIKSIKGIGPKGAQRVIIELKDKVGTLDTSGASASSSPSISIDNSIVEEATAALLMLGFSKKIVVKVVEEIISKSPAIDVETLIKLALKSV